MARNPIPEQNNRLFTLAEDMIDGLTTTGAAVGVAQNTAAVMQAALDAARTAETAFQAARQGKLTATTAQTIADSNAKAFAATAKRILVPHLGATWSTVWAQVGFVNGTIETPKTIAERLALIASLRDYLASHTAQENAPLGITAAAAGTLFTTFSTARAALNTAMQTLGNARQARDAAIGTLRIRARGLVTELATLLDNTDPRWYAFGLNAPGDPETPGIPEPPTLTAGAPGSGILIADWPDTRRADRYRVWLKKPADPAFLPVATTAESDTTLTILPIGISLQLQITAANDAGESSPGPTATITLS